MNSIWSSIVLCFYKLIFIILVEKIMENEEQTKSRRVGRSSGETLMERVGGAQNPLKNPLKKWIVSFVVIVLVAWGTGQWFGVFSGIDRGTYQAVFLVNNQVYFGHLRGGMWGVYTLKDAHTLQVASTEPRAVPPISLNIVSLKNQAHTPVDIMYIPREQVLFWENLKLDSPAIKVIEEQKAAQ